MHDAGWISIRFTFNAEIKCVCVCVCMGQWVGREDGKRGKVTPENVFMNET